MLTKNSKPAGLAAHSRVPHVRRIDRNNQIHTIVLLKDCKLRGVLRTRGRNTSLRVPRSSFWLECRIEFEVKSRGWEKIGDPLQISQTDRRLNFPQRHETLYVRLEHRPLFPRPERLVDMCID